MAAPDDLVRRPVGQDDGGGRRRRQVDIEVEAVGVVQPPVDGDGALTGQLVGAGVLHPGHRGGLEVDAAVAGLVEAGELGQPEPGEVGVQERGDGALAVVVQRTARGAVGRDPVPPLPHRGGVRLEHAQPGRESRTDEEPVREVLVAGVAEHR